MSGDNFRIDPDSEFGKRIGFTSDKFDGWLWKKGNYVYISFIQSKQEKCGNLKALFEAILQNGLGIKVPTPLGRMRIILLKNGFRKDREYWEKAGEYVEVWVKEVKRKNE